MSQSIPACPVCGTWTCANCGWRRLGASLNWVHSCHRCGGTRGLLVPARHRIQAIRDDHSAAGLRLKEKPMTETTQARPGCPDGGTCHHWCESGSLTDCFRVSACAPLSGVYVNDRWPEPAATATKEPQR